MIDQLQEIASYLAEGSAYELKRWWKIVDQWIKRLLTAILIWPIAMIICAIWSPWMAQKVVPFLALMPAAFLFYFVIQRVANPATVALLAVARIRAALLKTFRTLATAIAVELLLGLYLWLFPISNDRWLIPGLALAVLAFFALRLAEIGGAIRNLLVLLIIGITVIFILGGRERAVQTLKSLEAGTARQADPQAGPGINYGKEKICDDAFANSLDHRNEVIPYIDITLREGCFGSIVRVPQAWHTWRMQPIGSQENFWWSIWIVGERNARGPFGPNQDPDMTYNTARFQGHGTLRFYSNDVAVNTVEPKEEKPPEAPIVTIDARDHYVQEKFCVDQSSPDGQLHYEDLNIDHFTVKMQEGCWSPYIFPPNSWDEHFHNIKLTAASLGREPDWWIAIWVQGRTPAGPFTRNDSNSSEYRWAIPNNRTPFRLQGKGEIWIGKPNPF